MTNLLTAIPIGNISNNKTSTTKIEISKSIKSQSIIYGVGWLETSLYKLMLLDLIFSEC